MRSEKPLKEINVSVAKEEDIPYCLFNRNTNTLIKIPKTVFAVLEKMNGAGDTGELGGQAADIFAMAVAYRRASNVTESLKNWKDSNANYHPSDSVTIAFSKFLRTTLLSPIMKNYFNDREITALVDFFAKCPHGYELKRDVVWAHSELKPIIT